MLEGVVIDDTQLFNVRLQEWEACYKTARSSRKPDAL